MTKFARPQIKKTIRIFTALAAVSLALAATTALANPATEQGRATHPGHSGRGHAGKLFERWDKDRDGRIAIAELPARMKTHLSTIDSNKDGYLTREEFEKGKGQLHALREKAFDKNGDGKITDEERREVMRAHLVERFVEQDKNHDGAIVAGEVPAPAFEHMKTADANSDAKITLDELKLAFDEGKLRPPRGGHGPKSEAQMKAHAQERFNADDRNKDGYLTEAEVPKQMWEHIKQADANRDNRVAFDELTAAFKAGKMGGHRHRGAEHHKKGNASRQ